MNDDDFELVKPSETEYSGEVVDIVEGPQRRKVVVTPPDESSYLLPPRTDIEKISLHHTYDAFTWGYKGSGPHLTSASLLADAYQDRRLSQDNMHDLVNDYVSELESGEGWSITAGEIHEMLTK